MDVDAGLASSRLMVLLSLESGDLAPIELPRPCSSVYIIQGIAAIPSRPRLNGSGRTHLSGDGVQFEAKMNFQRPARSLRFSGFAMVSIWTNAVCEPLNYAQLGHSDFHRIRVAFMYPVPADQPKQQSFL